VWKRFLSASRFFFNRSYPVQHGMTNRESEFTRSNTLSKARQLGVGSLFAERTFLGADFLFFPGCQSHARWEDLYTPRRGHFTTRRILFTVAC
jgi:hypothetical protein